jgi:hypothetical protein
MTRHKSHLLPLIFLILSILSCNLFSSTTPQPEDLNPTPQPTQTNVTATEEDHQDLPRNIEGPGNTMLSIELNALDKDVQPTIEILGDGDSFWSTSPFDNASEEFLVYLGDAQQVGMITMTVPLESTVAKNASYSPDRVYLVWAQPDQGFPSLVGSIVEDGKVTFPLVGAGRYQVISLLSSEALRSMFSKFDPLTVPTYPQKTPAWCSPTALTNLVQYHQGAWPAGGYGSVWGESSNWYLAGQAGQPFNHGYFFHWLLGAGGYPVPSDVKQSFSNENHEVFIWNWRGAIHTDQPIENVEIVTANYGFAEYLFDAYKAYVEHQVWGADGSSRPVAWGSSLAGHSRTITGSDGEVFFYNDPSSGSLNQSQSWDAYRQAVMDSLTEEKVEVIDTVVLHAPPRPEEQRRGVLWLTPHQDDFAGSVTLLRGPDLDSITNWLWDGDLEHEFGYYFEDLSSTLPDDPVFGSQFHSTHIDDLVEYSFAVFNISDQSYDYRVEVTLTGETDQVPLTFPITEVSLNGGSRKSFHPAGNFPLKDLTPGIYRMQFTLYQGGIIQDIKYVQFKLAPIAIVFEVPTGILTKDAFCRKGPGLVFDDVTAFVKDTQLELIGLNPERTWGKFETIVAGDIYRCWISLSVVDLYQENEVSILQSPPTPKPIPKDSEAPGVWISHSPSGDGKPTDIEEITFTAEASDNIGVAKIELWISPPGESQQLLKTCSNTNSCIATGGPYDPGEMSFWAIAWDAASNQGTSETEQFNIFAVSR